MQPGSDRNKITQRRNNMGQSYDLYRSELLLALQKISNNDLDKLINAILDTLGKGTIYICGNGGSASTAEHMSCDLAKSVYKLCKLTNKNRLKVMSLNSNISKITAIDNDSDYKNIFSDQLFGFVNPGDLLIVITASGNSPDILEALKTAKASGCNIFGLLGFGGGKAKDLANQHICVESNDYGVVEDCHLIINHMVTDYLKTYMLSRDQK